MKDKANKGYWQRLAKIYAPLMESDKKFYNAICGYIRDYLKSDMNVLELACGTGQLSFPLSDCTNSWTATDFSENMIKQAKRRGTTEKLSFCVADATALSYENEKCLLQDLKHTKNGTRKIFVSLLRIMALQLSK